MKDKKVELFTHRDFYHLSKGLCRSIANDANEVLNKKLAECPRVYGTYKSVHSSAMEGIFHTYKTPSETHTALLFDVQPIRECEHEALTLEDGYFFCGKCDKKLKPKGWETV